MGHRGTSHMGHPMGHASESSVGWDGTEKSRPTAALERMRLPNIEKFSQGMRCLRDNIACKSDTESFTKSGDILRWSTTYNLNRNKMR